MTNMKKLRQNVTLLMLMGQKCMIIDVFGKWTEEKFLDFLTQKTNQ